MRTIIAILFISLFATGIQAQNPLNCRGPLPENIFRQKHKSVMMQSNDNLKLEVAIDIAMGNCMTSEQVKSIAALFNDDYRRLDFTRQAFVNTVDKENFYFVYDAFTYLSTVFMLHDYVQSFNRHPHDYLPPVEPPVEPPAAPVIPAPCIISPQQFNDMIQSIRQESFKTTKMALAKNIIKSNPCFTSNQIKDIVLEFAFESGRLEIAKYAWDYTVDKENYYVVADAFSFSSSKEDLMNYIDSRKTK